MSQRVRRPLGLQLAIVSAIILFSGWTLVKFYIAYRLNRGVQDEQGIIFGTTLPYDWLTQLSALLGVIVLISALFAWWGKPPQIRFVFQGAVLLTAILLIAETIYRLQPSDEPSLSIVSGEDAMKDALRCQIPLQILTALYIIWYCNRAPARAFYRQEPLRQLSEEHSP